MKQLKLSKSLGLLMLTGASLISFPLLAQSEMAQMNSAKMQP